MGCEVIATAWKGYSGVVIDCRDCFEVMGELRAMRFLFVPAQMVWRKFYGLEADFASHAAELEADVVRLREMGFAVTSGDQKLFEALECAGRVEA